MTNWMPHLLDHKEVSNGLMSMRARCFVRCRTKSCLNLLSSSPPLKTCRTHTRMPCSCMTVHEYTITQTHAHTNARIHEHANPQTQYCTNPIIFEYIQKNKCTNKIFWGKSKGSFNSFFISYKGCLESLCCSDGRILYYRFYYCETHNTLRNCNANSICFSWYLWF